MCVCVCTWGMRALFWTVDVSLVQRCSGCAIGEGFRATAVQAETKRMKRARAARSYRGRCRPGGKDKNSASPSAAEKELRSRDTGERLGVVASRLRRGVEVPSYSDEQRARLAGRRRRRRPTVCARGTLCGGMCTMSQTPRRRVFRRRKAWVRCPGTDIILDGVW